MAVSLAVQAAQAAQAAQSTYIAAATAVETTWLATRTSATSEGSSMHYDENVFEFGNGTLMDTLTFIPFSGDFGCALSLVVSVHVGELQLDLLSSLARAGMTYIPFLSWAIFTSVADVNWLPVNPPGGIGGGWLRSGESGGVRLNGPFGGNLAIGVTGIIQENDARSAHFSASGDYRGLTVALGVQSI
jgi:hypothetical protein